MKFLVRHFINLTFTKQGYCKIVNSMNLIRIGAYSTRKCIGTRKEKTQFVTGLPLLRWENNTKMDGKI